MRASRRFVAAKEAAAAPSSSLYSRIPAPVGPTRSGSVTSDEVAGSSPEILTQLDAGHDDEDVNEVAAVTPRVSVAPSSLDTLNTVPKTATSRPMSYGELCQKNVPALCCLLMDETSPDVMPLDKRGLVRAALLSVSRNASMDTRLKSFAASEGARTQNVRNELVKTQAENDVLKRRSNSLSAQLASNAVQRQTRQMANRVRTLEGELAQVRAELHCNAHVAISDLHVEVNKLRAENYALRQTIVRAAGKCIVEAKCSQVGCKNELPPAICSECEAIYAAMP